jgi:6-phosphogluconolactonase
VKLDERVRVVADAQELAHAACEHVRAHARAALAARGVFHLALAGGSTPRATYRELDARLGADESARWHIWFGDERCVAPAHPDSNFRMAQEAWLYRLAPAQIERLRGEDPPAAEAARYEARLRELLGTPPRLDLVLLGLGPDGHTASLFPFTPALEAESFVTVGRAPKPPHERLTLTLSALSAARALAFLVSGSDKTEALRRALDPAERLGALCRTPAALVTPSADAELLWLVDRAAHPTG